MTALALTEGWDLAITVGQMVINVALAFSIWWLRQNAKRIDSLEAELKASAEQIIDSKLSGVATKLEGVINVLNERIDVVRERLRSGDANFADLDRRDRELEQKFALRFDALKDYLHQVFATKDEVAAAHRRIDALKKGDPS